MLPWSYDYFSIYVEQQDDNIELIIPDFLDKQESLVCDESIFTFATRKKDYIHAAQTLLISALGPPLRLTLCHNLTQTGLIIFSPNNRDGSIPRKVIHTALKKVEVGTCLVLHINSLLCYHYHWQRHLERVAEKPMSSRYRKQLLNARSPKERSIPIVTWPLQNSIIVLYYLCEIALQQKSYSSSWLTRQVLWPEVSAVVAKSEM